MVVKGKKKKSTIKSKEKKNKEHQIMLDSALKAYEKLK